MNFKGPSLWRGARSIHNPLFDKINCNLHYKYFLFVNNKYLLSHSQCRGKLKSRCDTSKSTQSWKWCSFNSSLDLSIYIHIFITSATEELWSCFVWYWSGIYGSISSGNSKLKIMFKYLNNQFSISNKLVYLSYIFKYLYYA